MIEPQNYQSECDEWLLWAERHYSDVLQTYEEKVENYKAAMDRIQTELQRRGFEE